MRSTKASWLLLIILPIGVWAESSNWLEEMKLELDQQPDKLALCQALQRLQLQQQQQPQFEQSGCLQILEDEQLTTGELLMDTQRRCWWGWELFGRRCRKRA